MTSIKIGSVQLDCVDRGRGETVVLVHGSASDRRTWQAQIGALAPDFRVLAYSRRHHWPNARIEPGADYSMAEHVADLGVVVASTGSDPVHLVGHSYGAFVALLLAIERPELVRSLVLVEPPVLTLFTSDPPRPYQLLKLLCTRPRTALAIARLGILGFGPAAAAARRGDEGAAIAIFGTAVLGREAFEALSAARLEQARANFIAAELLGSGLPPLEAEAVRAIRCPALLVVGERSPRVFHRFAERLLELLPAARSIEMAGASHIVHEDAAEAFNAALASFLAAVSEGSAAAARAPAPGSARPWRSRSEAPR